MWINRFKIYDYHHTCKLVFEYIWTFYNTVKIHSHCGYLSPNAYEQQYTKKIVTVQTIHVVSRLIHQLYLNWCISRESDNTLKNVEASLVFFNK